MYDLGNSSLAAILEGRHPKGINAWQGYVFIPHPTLQPFVHELFSFGSFKEGLLDNTLRVTVLGQKGPFFYSGDRQRWVCRVGIREVTA